MKTLLPLLFLLLIACQEKTQNQAKGHPHGATAQAPTAQKFQKWHCPMHPQIIRDHKESCPLCGMDLVPVKNAGESPAQPEHPVLQLSPAVIQKTGVKIIAVSRGAYSPQIRGWGLAQINESKIKSISAWSAGFVKKLRANQSQMPLHQGQELLRIFSPEWQNAQREYLLALQNPDANLRSELKLAAQSKLKTLGFPPAALQRLIQSGSVQYEVPLFAPQSGILWDKKIVEGQSVSAGQELLQIADLSSLWLLAEFPQGSLGQISLGKKAQMKFIGETQIRTGSIQQILPTLNPNNKALQVRIAVSNPKMQIKVGQSAEVLLEASSQTQVLIPEQAAIPTGDKTIVILSLGNGKFQIREIKVGLASQGFLPVLQGLQVGDSIVQSAQFLLESESNLQAAIEAMK